MMRLALLAILVAVSDGQLPEAARSSRDFTEPWLGMVKGIANGDFARQVLTRLGVASSGKEGSQRQWTLVKTQDIPWPKIMSEMVNQLETEIARLASTLTATVRRVEATRTHNQTQTN